MPLQAKNVAPKRDTLAKPQPTTKPTGHITSYIKNELWQMDISDLSIYINRDYRYLLIAVGVFSRTVFTQPLINIDGYSIKDAFLNITKKQNQDEYYQIMTADF